MRNPPRGRVSGGYEDGKSDGDASAPAGGLVGRELGLVLDVAKPADLGRVVLPDIGNSHRDLVGFACPHARGSGRNEVAVAVGGAGRWRGQVAVFHG